MKLSSAAAGDTTVELRVQPAAPAEAHPREGAGALPFPLPPVTDYVTNPKRYWSFLIFY